MIYFLQARVESGLNTLRKLIMTRPAHRMRFLDVLLEFTSSDKIEVSQHRNLTLCLLAANFVVC